MSNIDKRPYRADGGDIGTGRIREIADNPYGDEEKCWLAKRVLALLDELDSLESFRIAFTEFHGKTEWVQGDKRFGVIKPWGKHRADVLREYIEHLESKLESAQMQPVMFIDGDISSADADKLAAVIREFNEEIETPAARMARIIRENPHPTNMCDMPSAGTGKGE